MAWPQVTFIALMALTVGINLAKHGEAYRYNFWNSLLGAGLTGGLLYAGGFFS
ncbi:MAG TPA: hypothetical protein PKY73_17950 [Hyphomonas sp.]|nr:hypothetical protein [Hyphomonas sp.]